MYYRTRTYIAGGWDENKQAIQKLYEWNNSERWALDFADAHELTQSRDTSLPCTIKESLSLRLSGSKTFVLVVGGETNGLRKGSCQYCRNYQFGTFYSQGYCLSRKSLDSRSFIDYECDIALRAYKNNEMKIVVLYDAMSIDRSKCPEQLRYVGKHIPMKTRNYLGNIVWDYSTIRDAIMY